MEQMIKFSKIGYVAAKVFRILAWVCTAIMLVAIVLVCVTKDTSGLIYKGDRIAIYSPVELGETKVAEALTVMASASAALLFMGFTMKELEKILFGMKEGNSPFTTENVVSIRRIVLFTLIGWLVSNIIAATLEAIFHVDPATEFNGGSMLLIIVIYLLSFVFEYGVKLQTQVDETL